MVVGDVLYMKSEVFSIISFSRETGKMNSSFVGITGILLP